jgi:hypothetical protein
MGCVLSLSRSFLFWLLVTGLRTDREPYRAKVLCLFWKPPALILNFAIECQYFFLNFLGSGSPPERRRDPPAKYCSAGLVGADWLLAVLEAVPVASARVARPGLAAGR